VGYFKASTNIHYALTAFDHLEPVSNIDEWTNEQLHLAWMRTVNRFDLRIL